jgi:hypothetical protein
MITVLLRLIYLAMTHLFAVMRLLARDSARVAAPAAKDPLRLAVASVGLPRHGTALASRPAAPPLGGEVPAEPGR